MANPDRTVNTSLPASNDGGDDEYPSTCGSIRFPPGQSGSSKADYDVITVHGLRDDFKAAWTDKEGSRWVRDQLFENQSIREINFSYEIDEYATIYDPLCIMIGHGNNLLGQYAEVREKLEKTEANRPIIWICNDIGGTIVKQALLSASNPPMGAKYGNIAMLTSAIIFLGPLHQFERVYYLQEQLQKLINLPGPEIKYRPEIMAKNLATQVQSINEDFLKTKLFDRAAIFNVFSRNSPSVYVSEGHRIHLREPLESSGITQCVDIDHLDLVRGCQSHWISGMANTFKKGGCVLDIDRHIIQFQAQLLALAPPTRVLDMSLDSISSKSDVVEWIYKQEPLISFSRPGPGFDMIHLHGGRKRLVDISEMSRLFYAHYNAPITGKTSGERFEGKAIYFEFDQHDSRYNTISSLLTYLINAIIGHFWLERPKDIADELSFLSTTRSWTVEDLYHLYATLRDGIGAAHKLTIFISCFDQCPEYWRQWFLGRVLEEQSYSEARYRIILSTSTRDGLGTEPIQERARVNLANYSAIGKSIAELTIDLQSGLSNLIKRHDIFTAFQPKLNRLLKRCRDATHLGHIILKWLEKHSRGGSGIGIAEKINDLYPPTVDNTVYAFIFYLERRRKERAANAFNWIKHAAEPWSPESLVEALAVYEDGVQERSFNDLDIEATMHDIEKALGGIIIVKNGDVKFSHPSFYHAREFGIDGSAEERAAQVNSQIAKTCLRYFQLEEAQAALEKLSSENLERGILDMALDAVVISHPRASLAEYAVRFWPQHYKASGKFKPRKLACKLFSSAKFRAAWEIPFWLLSNPFTRIQRSYRSPIPVFAMLELEDSAEKLVGMFECELDQRTVEKNCWYAITEAARVGNKKTVDQLLEHVAVDLEELPTALFWAAAAGNANIVDVLVQKIPDIKSFEWPEDIIHRAAAIGMTKLLQIMVLMSGCDVNKIGGHPMPPLQIAVWRNNIITTEGLLTLRHKPDLVLMDRNGNTPMMVAASRGNPRMIESLLKFRGANLEMREEQHLGLVQLAVIGKKHKAAEMLIEAGADYGSGEIGNDAAFYERPPLVVAASIGSRECVRALLKYEADPNVECATGTALYQAVMNNHTDVVQLLLNHEPKPKMGVVPSGQPILLMQAVCTGNAELVSLLIQHGAEVDVIDPNGDSYKTPLSRACKEGYLEVVVELLKNEANINYTESGSNAPLFAALQASQVKVAKYLLRDKSVGLKWKKDDGMGLLHAAWDLPDIITELLRRGVPVDDYMKNHGTALHIAARLNHPESIEALLRSDPKPDLEYRYKENNRSGDEVGCTALLLACLNPAPKSIELLLDAGADPRSKNSNGNDAVDLLLQKEPDSKDVWKCLKLLISKRKTVPIDGKNSDGYTRLAVAVKNGNISAAKYLIEQGANVNVVGPSFGSILHLAVKCRSLDLVKLLVDSGANHKIIHHEDDDRSLLSMAASLDEKDDPEHKIMRYLSRC